MSYPLILGLQELAELLELSLHLEETGDLADVLLGLKGLDDLAEPVLVVAVQLRAVVRDAAEFLYVVYCVIRRNAHDGSHLIAAAVVIRRPALSADTIVLLKDRVIFVSFLLQIHTCGKACRASSDDADSDVFVHGFLP